MTDDPSYSITIDYDDFLTRFDLDEIIYSIDCIIEGEEPRRFDSPGFPYWYKGDYPRTSYVGITAVRQGSIILSVILTTAVTNYVANRFRTVFRDGRLSDEIKRSALLLEDRLASIVQSVNDYFEKVYIPYQKEREGKIKKIKMKKQRKKKIEPPGKK